MVEGPGCKLKGECMRRRIKGKIIVSALSPSKVSKGNDAGSSTCFHELNGLKVIDIRTLGKELFIFFEESPFCLRIHFLMDGSVRYGDSKDRRHQVSDASLLIHFMDDKLAIFKSSVDIRSAEDSSKHCDSLADLDICSPLFNFKRAQQRIEERPTELICDVIMDQTVLPGVGNIIKNEGLFKSGINPTLKVQDLSPELVSCLLHRLRDFSAVFYMCRKSSKPLKDHLSIYEKTKCSECHNQVTVCKPGCLSRLTFYCSTCQINSNTTSVFSLPKKNSLLGYLQLNEDVVVKDNWECPVCTFINNSESVNCAMCASSNTVICRKRRHSDDSYHPESSSKRLKMENEVIESSLKVASHNQQKDLNEKGGEKSVVCSSHQKPCCKRTVTRPGPNKGRLFYSCSLRGNNQCKFFQWADLNHPRCKHDKVTVLRRVLKQNSNNGKAFYCCPQQKTAQCDFFQWA